MSGASRGRYVRLPDIIFLAALALAGLILTLWIFLPARSAQASRNILEVKQDGALLYTLPLSEDTKKEVLYSEGHRNVFVIQGGEVWMESADCGDETCVRTGHISRAGESIVCLPHRLTLRILPSGKEDFDNPGGLDAVVQ